MSIFEQMSGLLFRPEMLDADQPIQRSFGEVEVERIRAMTLPNYTIRLPPGIYKFGRRTGTWRLSGNARSLESRLESPVTAICRFRALVRDPESCRASAERGRYTRYRTESALAQSSLSGHCTTTALFGDCPRHTPSAALIYASPSGRIYPVPLSSFRVVRDPSRIPSLLLLFPGDAGGDDR